MSFPKELLNKNNLQEILSSNLVEKKTKLKKKIIKKPQKLNKVVLDKNYVSRLSGGMENETSNKVCEKKIKKVNQRFKEEIKKTRDQSTLTYDPKINMEQFPTLYRLYKNTID